MTRSPSALRAILFADAVQYARHVHANERAALDFVESCFVVLRDLAALHGGEVLKTMGDGALVEFSSASEAVVYALAAQERLGMLADDQPAPNQIRFRIGIHLGEVTHRDGDVYGHIVNVASRLEPLAEPGGVCISHAVFEQVRQSVPATYGSLGQRSLKNLPQPIVAYRVTRGNGGPAEDRGTPSGEVSVSVIEGLSLSDAEGNEIGLRSIKARALVGYLVLSRHNREAKDRILALLWSNQDLRRAREEFRSVVRQVQRVFRSSGSEAFRMTAADVRMVLSELQVDLLAASSRLSEGIVEPELIEGRMLPERIMSGLEQADQVFESWLSVTRHRWRDQLIGQLEACLLREPADSLSHKHAAIALLAIDATHEPAARALMNAYASEGKAAAALRVYQALREILEREFAIEPSAETQAAMQEIRAGRQPPPERSLADGPAGPAPEGRLPVIAVRPFVSPEVRDVDVHLLTGFHAELISSLIKFRDWVIVEEQEGPRLQDARTDERADYRLEADIRPAPSGTTVGLTLLDASNERVVWNERHALQLQEWGAVSSGIARRTAAVLDIYLSAERVAGHPGRRDVSLAAYDGWLRGENLLTLWQPEAELEAERLFRWVIDQMPRFAPAYASLASIYNVRHLIVAGFRRDGALEAEALALAQKAVQIDPLETRAHLTLAWSYLMAGRYEQADIHYDLAFDLNPNNPKTLLSCAHGLAFSGRTDRASELAGLALGFTPFITPFQWEYLTGIRFILGDYPGAVAAAARGANSMHDTLMWKASALALMGREEDARHTGREFLASVRAQWPGEPPQEREIVDWILRGPPIRERETRERLTRGLRLAGLPLD